MQQFGLPGIDPKSIASQEQFNKMAGMIAQTQFQSLGGTGTDKQLGSTELTSPNSELSKMGNKGIIAMLKGNEDAIAAKNREWQDYAQAMVRNLTRSSLLNLTKRMTRLFSSLFICRRKINQKY